MQQIINFFSGSLACSHCTRSNVYQICMLPKTKFRGYCDIPFVKSSILWAKFQAISLFSSRHISYQAIFLTIFDYFITVIITIFFILQPSIYLDTTRDTAPC